MNSHSHHAYFTFCELISDFKITINFREQKGNIVTWI